MTLGSKEVGIDRPTQMRVKPVGDGKKKTQIFEMIKVEGKEPILRALADFVREGGTVTVLGTEDCTQNNCLCRVGKIMSNYPTKTVVMILDDNVDIEPIVN